MASTEAGPPYTLPPEVTCYKETPVWTAETMPKGLLKAHSTMAGVFVRVSVIEGSMIFVYELSGSKVPLTAGETAVARPKALHHVEPLSGLKFKLQFYRDPISVSETEDAAHKTGVGAIDSLEPKV